MNRKIVISAFTIFAVAAVVVGATTAFFSDTETSTGNTFAAGAIDLTIDNESYYWDGEAIVDRQDLSWYWANSVDGLFEGKLFFNFSDIKPGDFGEDTISIHVDNNESWACAAVTLTSDSDVDCTEPELTDDPSCVNNNDDPNSDGDLARELNFIWWADDEDNVFESVAGANRAGETIISEGTLGDLGVGNTAIVTLADSKTNVFGIDGQPLPEEAEEYIGKGWCFGDLNPASVINDGQGDPATRGETGFTCDGASVIDNASQTDSTTLDVSFYAVQARNNPDFMCSSWTPPTPTS